MLLTAVPRTGTLARAHAGIANTACQDCTPLGPTNLAAQGVCETDHVAAGEIVAARCAVGFAAVAVSGAGACSRSAYFPKEAGKAYRNQDATG